MSDWIFLNKHRVKEPVPPRIQPEYCTTDADGFMGMFRFAMCGKLIRCIASDGGGWKHVSVSIEGETKPPSWMIMCAVKDLFWEDEEIAVQFHPKHSEYVNHHPGCLHLWSPTGAVMPTPPSIMVGIKKKY